MNSNIFLVFIIVITIFNVIHKIKYSDISISYSKELKGTILDINKKENITEYVIKNNYKYIVYYSGNKNFNLGDKIQIIGNIEKFNNNTIFNLFNYKNYYLSKSIKYKSKADNIVLINKNRNLFYKLKTFLLKRINKSKKSEYLKTFILGDSRYIKSNIIESYRTNGISHLFSVSGMHITLLSSIILFLLNKIKKSNYNYIIVILFLIIFTFLTNFTPSVIRASMLFIVITLNKFLKLNLSTLKILIFILLINLNVNPYNIYNIGFQFSYVVTFFLILFNKIINNYNNYISKIFFTSLISFLSSVPIMINNFFSINLLTIINNIIFVPFVSLIVFPFSLIVLIIPQSDFIYEIFINILEFISFFINKFKLEIILCKISYLFVFIYYIIIIYVLNSIKKKKYKNFVLFIALIIIHTNINTFLNNPFITFIDIGQGDSSIVHFSKNRGDILIDTGGKYNSDLSKNTISYLKSNGIKNLDVMILSHGDYDHMGEAINLVENFKVEKVIFNCGAFNDLEKELIKVLDKKKIKYYSCIKELNIDKNKLDFLQTKEYDNENDNSNIIYIELNSYKFIFMGDAGVTTEKEILNKYNLPDIDVLKIGHHGSKTSSGKEFIDEINPKYSVISVGKNNRYGHPNKEVLENLKDSNIYRTDKDGSIMFKIKNNILQVETCSP